MGNVYGYVRVSRDQNEDRQIIAMRDVQIPEENIFIDKQSGKDFNRPQYDDAIKYFKAAVKLHPAYGTAYCNLANAYYKKGSERLSVDSYRQAIKFSSPADGNYAFIVGDYSLLLAKMNMIENSQQYLEKAQNYGYAYVSVVQNEIVLANQRVAVKRSESPNPTVINAHITNNNLFVNSGTPGMGIGAQYPVVEEFATKLRTSSIVWMIIGILQIIIGFASIYVSLSTILISICGISNIFASIKLKNKTNEFMQTGRGMVEFVQGNTLGQVIFTGIWNLLFGGVVGIVISVFEYIIYDYGKKHLAEFMSIENSLALSVQ